MVPHEHLVDDGVDIDGTPSILEGRHPLSMIYGGGGVFGIAYGAGVAHGLAACGIPVAAAPSLGTSAGSWVASAVALGLGYEHFEGLGSPPVPTRRPFLHDAASEVFGDATHHLVSVSAVCLRTTRRHILDGGRYRLADLVAASSSVPGLFPPHRIDERLYVDGGMWSATSVDASVDAEQVIVIAPLAGPVMGPMGRTAGFMLARELDAWRRQHSSGTITMIRPNKAIARLAGRNPLNLFDADRARDVYPLAVEQGLRWGARLEMPLAA
jgi:predicted acylesterase/phospholipase RssA